MGVFVCILGFGYFFDEGGGKCYEFYFEKGGVCLEVVWEVG